MPKQLIENNTSAPRFVGGVWLLPGENRLVEVGPVSNPPQLTPIYQDPVTKKVYDGQGQEISSLVSGVGNDGAPTGRLGLRRPLSNLLTKSWCGRYNTLANGADHTTHVQTALAGHFDRVRLLIPNCVAATVTGVKASIAVTNAAGAANSSATITPTGAWKDHLFSGASSANLPAGTVNAPSWTATDWFDVNSQDRLAGEAYDAPLLNYRIEVPAANANITVNNHSVTDWEDETATRGWFWRARTQAVLGCTTKGSFTSTATAGQHYPVVIQYMSRQTGATVYVCTDSLGEGADTTLRNSGYPFWAARAASTLARPVEICNQGVTSAAPSIFLARAKALFAVGVIPDIMVYHPFSPNGVSGTIDAGEINVFRSALVDAMQTADTAQATLVLTNGFPANNSGSTIWGSSDSLRTDFNAALLGRGRVVFDAASMISGEVNGGQIEYASGASFDGVHPTLATRRDLLAPAFRSNVLARFGI